jgi:hypothetical protein
MRSQWAGESYFTYWAAVSSEIVRENAKEAIHLRFPAGESIEFFLAVVVGVFQRSS